MCGVIAYLPIDPSDAVRSAVDALFYESSARGLHAAGFVQPIPEGFQRIMRADWAEFDVSKPMIAHARYSTSGDWHNDDNNQPIVVEQVALAFNGVIHMGEKEEFEAAFNVKCRTANDGEVFIRKLLAGMSAADFLRELAGSFAGAWLVHYQLWVGRNDRRPLWTCFAHGAFWYASTRDIFLRAKFPEPALVPVGVVKV